ncbi:MAG: TolB family protein [Planctomycetota bacterium]|jgi:Tol biopolymer transport system component
MNLSRKFLWIVLLAAAVGCGGVSTEWHVGRSTLKASWGWGGTHLAYSVEWDGVTSLFVIDDDGSVCAPLATGTTGVFAWSPDGTRLVYVADDALYSVRADGSDRRRVAFGVERVSLLLWSPDSTRFAFTTAEFPGSTVLHTARADGSEVVSIESALVLGDVAWSPDGSRIAYQTSSTLSFEAFELRCALANGTGRTTVSRGGNVAFGIEWSPDGSRLLYRADEESPGVVALYSVGPDGSGRQRLSGELDPGRQVLSGFASSPDGAHVAYAMARHSDGAVELYTTPLGGGAPHRISDELAGFGIWPAFSWSRDDALLGFLTDAGGLFTFDPTNNQLVAIDLDVVPGFAWAPVGLRLAYRTADGVLRAFSVEDGLSTPIGECRRDFAWSPDGVTLAFFAISNGLHALFTASWEGGPWSLVSDIDPVRELLGPPAWSMSGNRIAFRATQHDGSVALYLAWPYGGAIRLACSD